MNLTGDKLLPEELDILDRLTNIPLNVGAMTVVTNLNRAAQKMKNKMEKEVLSQYGLSWTAFKLLYNLWIWGKMDARKLSESMGVTVATVSSVTNTLERKELCYREINKQDRRLVFVSLTDKGKQLIEELYPKFNQGEAEIVAGLSEEEQEVLTRLLRRIIRNMTD